MPRRLLLYAVTALAAAALVACGGGKKSSGSATPSDPQAASHSTNSGAPPGAVLDRIDLQKSVASLSQLKSFKFDMTVKLDLSALTSNSSSGDDLGAAILGLLGAFSDIKASGAVVAPDQADVRATLLGQEFGYVQIGQKAWMKTGAKWQPADPTASTFDLEPQDLFGSFLPDEVLKVAKTSTEKVNGVQTTRYSFDKSSLVSLVQDLGQGAAGADLTSLDQAALDVWLNGDNVPVKVALNVVAKTDKGQKVSVQMDMNVTNINDPSIKIVPPV
ncbi:MAG TPA: hypothetical protein VH951_06340 [Dehalococcoidia bacterium]|jgi:hypothetical protein